MSHRNPKLRGFSNWIFEDFDYYRHDVGHSLNSTCNIKPFYKIDKDILLIVTGDIAIT